MSSQASSSSATDLNMQTKFPQLLTTLDANINHHLQNHPQNFNFRPEVPPWLGCPPAVGAGPGPPSPSQQTSAVNHFGLSSSIFPPRIHSELPHSQAPMPQDNNNAAARPPFYHQPMVSPHMSATALLQKAAQMGATISKPSASSSSTIEPHQGHVGTSGFGLGVLSSHEDMRSGFGNKAATALIMDHSQMASPPPVLHGMMSTTSLSPSAVFEGSFEEAFEGMLGAKREGNAADNNQGKFPTRNDEGSDGLTRDFLGLRHLSHRDILNMAGLDPRMNPSSYGQSPRQKPWQV